jgi:ribose transport system ATP-binding protein
MVLRDGRKVGEMDIKDASIDRIIQMMVGKTLTEQYPKEAAVISETPILSVRGLTHRRAFVDVSFNVRRGEILGIAGLSGSGKSELARALFGAEELKSGTIEIEGQVVPARLTPNEAIGRGIAFLPADRKSEGVFLDHDVKYNITISNLTEVMKGWIRAGTESAIATDYVSSLNIKTPSIYQSARNLSGGNQQKVMLARWLFTKPKVLVFEEPTRGIDVNAKVEVYKLIGQFVKQGGAVVLVSSELPELEGMCDRVIVMHNGAIAAELSREQISQATIAHYSVQKVGEEPNGSK